MQRQAICIFKRNNLFTMVAQSRYVIHFAPELHIPNGTIDISFYKRFGAFENFCLRNTDNSIHVAEFNYNGAVFHLHETVEWFDALEPVAAKGVTAVIGLFVEDVDSVMVAAIN